MLRAASRFATIDVGAVQQAGGRRRPRRKFRTAGNGPGWQASNLYLSIFRALAGALQTNETGPYYP